MTSKPIDQMFYGLLNAAMYRLIGRIIFIAYQDFYKLKMLSRIVPKNIEYEHEKTWHDGNMLEHPWLVLASLFLSKMADYC
jgi:hypothetical protein